MRQVRRMVPRLPRVVWALVAAVLAGVTLTACAPGALPGATAQPVEGPRLVFQGRTHTFGTISASQKTEHRFALHNAGNRPLELSDVQPQTPGPGGCTWGVTAVASSAIIDPGASGHILVTFERPMVGMKDVLVRVRSNDATAPEQTLTLRFTVGP